MPPGTRAKSSTPRLTCANCAKPLRTTHKFCPNCGTPVAAAPASGPAPAAPVSGPSLQVGRHHDAATLEEQRKVVSVIFADLSGSTPLAERLDPEEMRSILSMYFNGLAQEIQRFGGTIDKYIGDAVMAVFGAPISHEDDAERAVGAGLAMQERIQRINDDLERRYGVRLSLRIGVNTGEVVAGALGGSVQNAYTVVGDTVNTAQRLESAAALNTVLVSEETYRLARRSFYFEALPPVTLKGKSEPVPAFRLSGRERRTSPRDTAPLVGRSGELAALDAAFASAARGAGTLVHVHGEPGIGKTRLVNELIQRLPAGTPRLQARCTSYETAMPYALIGELVRQAFRIDRASDEGTTGEAVAGGLRPLGLATEAAARDVLVEVLGHSARSALDPEHKRQLLVSVLRLLLEARSREVPLVIVVEAAQWIDQASATVLADVARDLAEMRCLLITTSRDPAAPFGAATVVHVGALDAAAAGALVESVAGHAIDPTVRTLIVERTTGNPFFIEEVAHTLSDHQTVRVPASIQDLLEARLDRLDGTARRVARRAAVIGNTFWEDVLARIDAEEDLAAALSTLERDAFVVPLATAERKYGFRHPLLQEVAYQTQLIAQRRHLHTLVGDAIAELFTERVEEFLDLLAFHYGRGDDDPKARVQLLAAARRAQRLFANREALAYFRQAVERSADDGASRSEAHEGAGDVLTTTGDLAGARAAYAEAVLTAPTAARARLERKTGVTYLRAGDYPQARHWLTGAQATLGDPDHVEAAAIWLDLAQAQWRQGHHDDAIAAARQGIAVAERAGAEQLRAEGYKHLGTIHVLKGDRDAGAEHYRRALEIYGALEDLPGLMNVHNNLGIVYRREGRWRDALTQQETALALARRIGDAWSIGMALANIGETLRTSGEREAALARNEEALAVWSQVGNAIGVATVHMNSGIVHAEAGHRERAREALHQALGEFEALGARLFLSELYRTLATVEDDPAEAVAWADRAVATARELRATDEEAASLQVRERVAATVPGGSRSGRA